MTFPKYPEYKDSGVEWLGEVPAHWKVVPLKHKANFINGFAFKPDTWADDGVPIIRIENLNGSDDFNHFAGEIDSRHHVGPGDLLFGWSGNRGTSFGPFIWPRPGKHFLNQHIFKVTNFFCDKSWFYWCLKAVTAHVEEQAHGIIGMVHITKGGLGAIKIPVPDIREQRLLGAFLDHETAKIDALVDEQKRLIELLKEKRQAVISHAVTKGLDPNVPMKDSGVEWLGQVPTHWRVGALRWYASIQGGVAKGKDYAGKKTVTLPYLRVANVQDGYIDLSDVREIEVLPEEVQRYSLRDGDVLMNEGGDNDKLGRGAVWRAEIAPCLHQNHVFAIRPNQHLLPEWLALFTQSAQARSYFFVNSKQSTNLASISSSNIMGCALPLPPTDEQSRIVSHVSNRAGRFDSMIAEAERAVELLLERRSALISAAITGKIDVRGWKPAGAAPRMNNKQEKRVTA